MLSRYVGQQSHEASALDSFSKLTLVLSRRKRALLRLNPCVRSQELLERIHVFVVDVVDLVFFEIVLVHMGEGG
jgi:hypothetical protein